MATSTIDDAKIIYTGNGWPTVVHRGALPPADADGNIFTNSAHHNVATAAYPVGTVVEIIDSTTGTPALFRYMQMGSAEASNAIAVKDLVGMQLGSGAWDGKLTNDDATVMDKGPALVALSAITDDYYGWWFQAGEVPVGTVSGLDGNHATDTNVVVATPGCELDVGGADFCVLGLHTAAAVLVAIATENDA